MNNKILVEIYLPASGESFDVLIPLESKMGQVRKLVVSVLGDLSSGKFCPNDETVLCDAETGTIFDINTEVAELGIKNGSRLMLI